MISKVTGKNQITIPVKIEELKGKGAPREKRYSKKTDSREGN